MEIVSDINSIDKKILENYAAVDIGNSQLKILYANAVESFPYNSDFELSLNKYITNYSDNKITYAISSVNNSILNDFLQILSTYKNHNYILAKTLLDSQKIINFSKVSGTGEDRKLGLIGGLLYCDAPLITVDVGTAITINVLDKERYFQGGVIMPGPITQIKTLNNSASGLKDFELEQPTSIIGKNTANAINSGIINGSIGAILFFIKHFQRDILDNVDCDVVLTGGASRFLLNLLEQYYTNIIYKPHIILLGLFYVLQKNNIEIE